jgi:hypothetical protein
MPIRLTEGPSDAQTHVVASWQEEKGDLLLVRRTPERAEILARKLQAKDTKIMVEVIDMSDLPVEEIDAGMADLAWMMAFSGNVRSIHIPEAQAAA